ncbi:MAG: UpxY family transcription antiterminator [bacterium]
MTETIENKTDRKWFALYTKPRHEFKAAEQLKEVGVEYFLPTITRTRQWSDRKKKVTEPLFRGYIFIHADERERLISVEREAVIRTIFFNGKPSVIPDSEIDGLKKILEKGDDVFVVEGLTEGSPVEIVSGPFEGVSGVIIESPTDNKKLAITIETLNRTVVVWLTKDCVVKRRDIP